MKIQQITNVRFTNQNAKGKSVSKQQVTIPKNMRQANDAVSFSGKVAHGINTSRKYIDYGDIFKPGVVLPKESYVKAKKDRARLMNANLAYKDFSKSVFHCANFEGANLTGTIFKDATLDGSKFINVTTNNNTDLTYTYLNGAIFDGEFGYNTDLKKANIMGADFKNTDINNLDLRGAIYNYYTDFPYGYDPIENGLIMFKEDMDFNESADFARMKLRYLNFDKANLRGAELKQINLNKAYLRNVNMKNSNLRGAILTWNDAQNVNLEGATYDQYTLFNEGFNPNAHKMVCIESSPAYYGIK
ncbi:pentapeptide repeat-containing protein [bacterium]|nr:pentapeptide repeat-containing protein [bacterium]